MPDPLLLVAGEGSREVGGKIGFSADWANEGDEHAGETKEGEERQGENGEDHAKDSPVGVSMLQPENSDRLIRINVAASLPSAGEECRKWIAESGDHLPEEEAKETFSGFIEGDPKIRSPIYFLVRNSGKRPRMSASAARQTPRSVMSPVIRRAGVTSNP